MRCGMRRFLSLDYHLGRRKQHDKNPLNTAQVVGNYTDPQRATDTANDKELKVVLKG